MESLMQADAPDEAISDDPLPDGSLKEQQIFQALVYSIGEALRCFTALLAKPPTPEVAECASKVFAGLVEVKKCLRLAQLNAPLVRPAKRTVRAPVDASKKRKEPEAPEPPGPIAEAMLATAWLLESIHQIMALPNRLTRDQRDAALDLSDALTDFVPLGALLTGGALLTDQAAE